MTEARPLLAYSFAHVRKQIYSLDELNVNGALKRQHVAQRIFEKVSGRRIVKTVHDWSTYRAAPFVSRQNFRHAVEVARNSGADLLLADVRELMERTQKDQIGKCAHVLDALDVEVWDATSRKSWQSMSQAERNAMVTNAKQVSTSRSKAVNDGLWVSRAERAAVPNANYKNGNRANRRNAYQRAHQLRDFVLKEMAKIPAGEKLSPSALAVPLNAAGISSARGGCWSHNTAKDLIARIYN